MPFHFTSPMPTHVTYCTRVVHRASTFALRQLSCTAACISLQDCHPALDLSFSTVCHHIVFLLGGAHVWTVMIFHWPPFNQFALLSLPPLYFVEWITQLFTSHGMMLLRFVYGVVKDCQQKQSGNMPVEQGYRTSKRSSWAYFRACLKHEW